MKTKEFFVTAKMTVTYPSHWTEADADEVFRRRLNTHLELNEAHYGEELMELDDVEIRQIAPDSPYREP